MAEHECRYEDKIDEIGKAIVKIDTTLENAITNVTHHIEAGSKWRLAIVCACIGLVGLAVGAIVKFAVMDYKVCLHDTEITEMRTQIFDLNYIKGRAEAMSEAKK